MDLRGITWSRKANLRRLCMACFWQNYWGGEKISNCQQLGMEAVAQHGCVITSSIRINIVMVEYFWFLTVVVVTWVNMCNKIVPIYTHIQSAWKTVEISLNSGLYQYQSPGFDILQVMQRCYHWRTLGEGCLPSLNSYGISLYLVCFYFQWIYYKMKVFLMEVTVTPSSWPLLATHDLHWLTESSLCHS